MMATERPAACATSAAPPPAAPLPMTRRSKDRLSCDGTFMKRKPPSGGRASSSEPFQHAPGALQPWLCGFLTGQDGVKAEALAGVEDRKGDLDDQQEEIRPCPLLRR